MFSAIYAVFAYAWNAFSTLLYNILHTPFLLIAAIVLSVFVLGFMVIDAKNRSN